MKKLFIWVLIIIILGAGGYFGFNFIKQKTNSSVDSAISAESIDLDAAVEVTEGTIKKVVSTSGYIKPENESYLSFATTGTAGGSVEKVFVEAGDIVEQGQQLVKLEDKQEHLNYLRAKNEYELAKIGGSSSQIEEKKLAMEVALDKYESKTLKSPFGGKVVDVFLEEGDYVEGYDNVIYLIDESSYEVEVSISEIDCLKVEVGQRVEIELDILKGQTFPGKVVQVAEYSENNSGVVTVPVTILMEEVSPVFKPGFSATADIIIDVAEDVILVPVTAVSTGEKGSMVIKVEENQGVPTRVETGINDGFYQEIVDGLKPGDKIIVNNYQMGITPSGQRGAFGGMNMPRIRP
ncbi:MAG: efflux RND transporter periplasmic adaptor subunit [Atribacterota bacterium]|nr:efflux RND transporter periplasmic adaptor subunit [Atribacterota bacterium]MDI9596509.1 efflux RND transporter periplasmic adaptor subunit [Atribacterota bacterium]